MWTPVKDDERHRKAKRTTPAVQRDGKNPSNSAYLVLPSEWVTAEKADFYEGPRKPGGRFPLAIDMCIGGSVAVQKAQKGGHLRRLKLPHKYRTLIPSGITDVSLGESEGMLVLDFPISKPRK